MDPIELTISDGDETYVLVAIKDVNGYRPHLKNFIDADGREVIKARSVWPICMQRVSEAGPYPTPYACLEAMFKAVVTELFGIRE